MAKRSGSASISRGRAARSRRCIFRKPGGPTNVTTRAHPCNKDVKVHCQARLMTILDTSPFAFPFGMDRGCGLRLSSSGLMSGFQ
jgi:hypothetical protein